jgi:glucosamine 6-phosphate synthetase-like amidotransferase/phosphosugar isomerase protein
VLLVLKTFAMEIAFRLGHDVDMPENFADSEIME